MSDDSLPNLTGDWIGNCTGHFEEYLRIEQEGSLAIATKITGDDHVPAGQITWRADVATGDGEGQIAEHDFRNARFIPGRLFIRNREHIRFEWCGVGAVEFRRDD